MARPPGKPQAPNNASPAARSGNRQKLYGYVLPELYEKARTSAAAANVSLGAYLERLIAADEVDADGRPLWATPDPTPATDQGQLPLAG